MIRVEQNKVEVGMVDTPLSQLIISINKDLAIRAEVTTDLYYLFATLNKEFGKGETAMIIEHALKEANNGDNLQATNAD